MVRVGVSLPDPKSFSSSLSVEVSQLSQDLQGSFQPSSSSPQSLRTKCQAAANLGSLPPIQGNPKAAGVGGGGRSELGLGGSWR